MSKQTLIRQRGTEKGRLTVISNWIADWNPSVGVRALQLRIEKLEQCYTRFIEIQNQILALEDDSSQICEGVNFETVYFQTLERAYDIIDSIQKSEADDKPSQTKVRVALPKLQLNTFSGDYLEWPAFSDIFTTLISNNPDLSNVQKLCYLKTVLKGSAANVIESLSVTNDNFKVAWDLLLERYGNQQLIVDTLLRTLMQQAPIEKESANNLRSLLETTLRTVQSLENMNQPVKTWNSILVYTIASKLDPVTRKAWELDRSYNSLSTYSDMIAFLKIDVKR